MSYIVSYDLGTGGLKTGLYREDGTTAGFEFSPYPTYYPKPDWHEQYPMDWWRAVCASTRKLLRESGIDPAEVAAVGSSGHSLVAVPIGKNGEILQERVPIWSDRRAGEEASEFFSRVDYKTWYMITGNGDPPETYYVFKLMWLKKHFPDIFAKTEAVIGSKDFINYMFTGKLSTDYSYASGSGVFELLNWRYSDNYMEAAGIHPSIFIEPTDSYGLVGTVTGCAAEMSGLCEGTKVFCGGVDNSCMALGTMGIGNGRAYTSLGSSSWIAVSSDKPVLDHEKLPFVFAHVEKGLYTTGVSIFAAANSYRWARDNLCGGLSGDLYAQMDQLAAKSPVGANGLMFNPSMAGGSSQEPSEALQGSFFGLKLSNDLGDILRSVLEGVALSLKCYCLPALDKMTKPEDAMILCGGGARSDLWMQIFADIFNKNIIVTNVDQDAASLGAAAIAARGAGFWKDYSPLDRLFKVQKTFYPDKTNSEQYAVISKWFELWVGSIAKVHDCMKDGWR
jgi:xylulokinase